MSTVKVKTKKMKNERVECRVTADQKSLIEHAAALVGSSVSSFIMASAQEAATRTIKEHETMRLSVRDSEIFAKALTNPPRPSARLRKAAKRYKALTGQ